MSHYAVLVCLSSNHVPPALPICYRRITQSTDFIPGFLSVCRSNSLWNEPKHTLNSRIIYFNIVYLLCLDLFLYSPLFKIDISTPKSRFPYKYIFLSISQDRHHYYSGSKGNGIIFFALFPMFAL